MTTTTRMRAWRTWLAGLTVAVLLAGPAAAWATHAPQTLEQAAARFAEASRQWHAVAHYTPRDRREADVAHGLADVARDFYYLAASDRRRSFHSLWYAWERLSRDFFAVRDLYRHQPVGYGRAPLSHHYRGYHRASGEELAWRALATAFYDLRDMVRRDGNRRHAQWDWKSCRAGYGTTARCLAHHRFGG